MTIVSRLAKTRSSVRHDKPFPLKVLRPVCQIASQQHEMLFMVLAAEAMELGLWYGYEPEQAVAKLEIAAAKLPQGARLNRCNAHANGVRLTLGEGGCFSRFEGTISGFLRRFANFDLVA